MTKKMIIAKCDAYNARFHHYDQRVLAYDGTTPVEWVMDDNYGDGMSEQEAVQVLADYASQDGYDYYDEERVAEYVAMVKEAHEYETDEPYEGDVDTSWYKGKGYYDEGLYPIYIEGECSYRHDTMSYWIVDFVEPIDEDEE